MIILWEVNIHEKYLVPMKTVALTVDISIVFMDVFMGKYQPTYANQRWLKIRWEIPS